jgi:predicted porin
MKRFGAAAASAAVILLNGAGGTHAADLDVTTKVPVLKAPADNGPQICTGIADFFTTACQLAGYGVRFYGTIDVGASYQTNGAPLDKYVPSGLNYNPGKSNYGAKWLAAPNGLSLSNIGFQIKEPLLAGWSLVGQVETGFDPYTLALSSGPQSLQENRGVPLALQNTVSDSNFQGTFYNSLGFVGLSSDTWGTLTVFRQGTLMRDLGLSYDPLGGAYAFSLIGGSGPITGGGSTENARATTAVKYRINYGDYRLGLFGQFGGYDLGNASRGVIQGQLGGDFRVGPGVFSADVVGGYTRDSVAESLGGGNSVIAATGLGNPDGTPTTITATISNNTNVMAAAKYNLNRLTLYAGYEWIQFAAPSDQAISFTDIAGYQIGGGAPGTAINNTQYNAKDKILQVVWAGVKYSITDALDVASAYYHYDQNQYATGSTLTNCLAVSTISSACAGTQDMASVVLDWRFAPKWDAYIGTMFTQLNGGLENGYLARNNWATTGGVRFRW